MLDCPRTQSGREVHQPTCLHQPNLNRVQFETRRFQFRSSPPLGDLGRLVLRASNWTRFRASGSIRTENAVQQSRRKTLKFCNGLPVIGSAGLSLLQKSAAKVRTFAISFATERSHNPV